MLHNDPKVGLLSISSNTHHNFTINPIDLLCEKLSVLGI